MKKIVIVYLIFFMVNVISATENAITIDEIINIFKNTATDNAQVVKDESRRFEDLPEDLKTRFIKELQDLYTLLFAKNIPKWFEKSNFSTLSNFLYLDEQTLSLKDWLSNFTTYNTLDGNIIKDFLQAIMRKIFQEKYPFIRIVPLRGYYYLFDGDNKVMKGERYEDEENLEKYKKDHSQELAKKLVKKYKIHLMPKISNLYEVLDKFLSELMKNTEFQKLIWRAKYKINISDANLQKEQQENIFPRIVIYTANGKEATQKALDIIYNIFKNIEGVNVAPRFNEKITSLIYVAQGDADHKDYEPEKYFEGPHFVYYKKDFTGEERDYHLQNPAIQRTVKKESPAEPTKKSTTPQQPQKPNILEHALVNLSNALNNLGTALRRK